jgi:tetratricopeptide (TPR) repeat protein
MAQDQQAAQSALEIDRLATQLAKDPHSKVFMPLAEEYGKVGMWQEAAGVLEDGLKLYPGFITAMVALGRAYDHMGQATKARAILEESVKLSPENLRAHRTLIKIYQSQGLNESALQSCAVILTINPRDEEARSIQAALGGPLKHKKEPDRSKTAVPVKDGLSAQAAARSWRIYSLCHKDECSARPDGLNSGRIEDRFCRAHECGSVSCGDRPLLTGSERGTPCDRGARFKSRRHCGDTSSIASC